MKNHIDIVHKRIKDFGCIECSKQFGEKGQMLNHIEKVHQNVRRYQCDQCFKNYKGKPDLENHLLKWHPIQTIDKCKKESDTNLQNFKMSPDFPIQDGSSALECKICFEILSGKKSLKGHHEAFHS